MFRSRAFYLLFAIVVILSGIIIIEDWNDWRESVSSVLVFSRESNDSKTKIRKNNKANHLIVGNDVIDIPYKYSNSSYIPFLLNNQEVRIMKNFGDVKNRMLDAYICILAEDRYANHEKEREKVETFVAFHIKNSDPLLINDDKNFFKFMKFFFIKLYLGFWEFIN